MAITKNFFLGFCVAALACVGCDGLDGDEAADFGEGEIQTRSVDANGPFLNGPFLNGPFLNGPFLNGWRSNTTKLFAPTSSTDYIQLTEVRDPDFWTTTSVSLVGGNLKVAGLSGWDAEGSRFKYSVKEGSSTINKQVWVNYAYPTSQSDVWEYQLQLSVDNGYSWPNLCGGEFDRALILNDLWDPDTGAKVTPRPTGAMTFACPDGALAKCVKLGYRPWASKNGTALADYHQACTRMIRADYCGDGGSHTTNGIQVHVLDQLGIQNVDPNVSYAVEAEWGPNGAVCLNPSNTRVADQNIGCSIPTCGSSFASGGLIQSGKIVP